MRTQLRGRYKNIEIIYAGQHQHEDVDHTQNCYCQYANNGAEFKHAKRITDITDIHTSRLSFFQYLKYSI